MMRRLLCRLGFHKWNVIPGSVTLEDRYTEIAWLICEHCAKTTRGERWL